MLLDDIEQEITPPRNGNKKTGSDAKEKGKIHKRCTSESSLDAKLQSCCIRLRTTGSNIQHLLQQQLATLLGIVASFCIVIGSSRAPYISSHSSCFKLRVISWACWRYIYLFFLFLFVSHQQFLLFFFVIQHQFSNLNYVVSGISHTQTLPK